MRTALVTCIVGLLIAASAGVAHAEGQIVASLLSDAGGSAPRNNGSQDFGGQHGSVFTPSRQITINRLGIWDGPNEGGTVGDGLETDADIALWELGKGETILATATVLAGTSSTLFNQYRYESLNGGGQVVLNAGQMYALLMNGVSGGNSFKDGSVRFPATIGSLDPEMVINNGVWDPESDVTMFPQNSAGIPGWFGPSAVLYIPEPSTAIMAALAAVGFVGFGRRRGCRHIV